jgi:hypothetical protein
MPITTPEDLVERYDNDKDHMRVNHIPPTTLQISALVIINDVRKESQSTKSCQNGDSGGTVGIIKAYR